MPFILSCKCLHIVECSVVFSYSEISLFLATANNLASDIIHPYRMQPNQLPIDVVDIQQNAVFTKKHLLDENALKAAFDLISPHFSRVLQVRRRSKLKHGVR